MSRTTRHVIHAALIAGALVWATASTAQAQNQIPGPVDPALDIQNFQPVASPFGIFTTDSAKVHSEYEFSAGFLLNYAKEPLVLNPAEGPTVPIVDQQLAGDLLFAIGLFDIAEVGAALPIYFVNDGEVGANAIEGATLGDLRLRPRVRVLDSESGLVGLGFYLQLGLPTGNSEAFTSSGSFYARPGVVVDTRIQRLLLSANMTVNVQEERQFGNLDVGSQLLYNAGAEYAVIDETFLVGGELILRKLQQIRHSMSISSVKPVLENHDPFLGSLTSRDDAIDLELNEYIAPQMKNKHKS